MNKRDVICIELFTDFMFYRIVMKKNELQDYYVIQSAKPPYAVKFLRFS